MSKKLIYNSYKEYFECKIFIQFPKFILEQGSTVIFKFRVYCVFVSNYLFIFWKFEYFKIGAEQNTLRAFLSTLSMRADKIQLNHKTLIFNTEIIF